MRTNNDGQYIVQKYDEKHKWCLHRICDANEEFANKVMADEQAKNPNDRFRVYWLDAKDCWWRYGTD